MRRSLTLLIVALFLSSCVMLGNSVSAVNAQENTWVEKAPMPTARAALGVAVVNDKIYAIGGANSSGVYPPDLFKGGFLGTNEEYNTVTNTWSSKSSMPTPRDYFAIAAYQNKIYCIGGAIGFKTVQAPGMLPGNVYEASRTNEEYDTITDTWTTKAPMPVAGINLQAVVVSAKIFVIGEGLTYVYDPIADTWTNKTSIPYNSYSLFSTVSAVGFGGNIVVFGESSEAGKAPRELVFTYNIEADSWSQDAVGPVAVSSGAAVATVGNLTSQRIYHVGLVRGAPPSSVNQMFDPKTGTWSTAKAPPSARMYFGLVVVNEVIFRIGGYNIQPSGVIPSNDNDQYTPFGYGTPDPNYLLENTPPKLYVLSPLNQTYNESSVSLVFNTDKAVNWTTYSLDGKGNVTITGNVTLTDLSNGLHNVTFYAEDTFGNIGKSETITFTVEKPEPFPTVAVVAISVIAVIVVTGTLVYFKKVKKARS